MTPRVPEGGEPIFDRRVFPSRSASVSSARHWVGDRLAGAGPEVRETVSLLVSELAANAVQHGGTPFAVGFGQTDDGVRVEVTDDGRGQPRVTHRGPWSPSGRGLLLVDALASAWGVREGEPPTKTVWFTVRPEP